MLAFPQFWVQKILALSKTSAQKIVTLEINSFQLVNLFHHRNQFAHRSVRYTVEKFKVGYQLAIQRSIK